jgi:hypothetical protein
VVQDGHRRPDLVRRIAALEVFDQRADGGPGRPLKEGQGVFQQPTPLPAERAVEGRQL